ncbi:MAG: alpha/beta hydrolase family esterase [Pyrinomonadaceae bacterium]
MRAISLFQFFLASMLLSTSALASANKVSKETLPSQGVKRTYYLFVPSSVQAAESAPLLVLLHGSGRNGLSLVEKWKELAEREGVILAGPDARDKRGWQIPADGPDFIRELIEALRAKYPVNPRRVYLFGHSAGAVFAINLSMLESEYFAATAVHAGSWRTEKEISYIEYARRKSPLAIIVGDRDAFFPLDSVKATEQALKSRGFPIELTIMKGHDHWYYDLAPEINRNAWSFLRQYELAGEQKYAEYNRPDEARQANAAIEQLNKLRGKVNELMQRFYAVEEEIRTKSVAGERSLLADLAREEVRLLTAGVALHQEATVAAEGLSRLKLKGEHSHFFALLAQVERKRAEALEVLLGRAELLLGAELPDVISAKRNAALSKAEGLQKEADELERKAEQVKAAPGA